MPDFIVRNFQALTEAKVSVKGFTLLIGESSAGKSAFMRAIYAATHNRFKIGQVKNGEEMSVIKVRYEDSPTVLTVARSHTGSPSMMLDKMQFSKMNRTVPPQVEEFNNFGTLEVGDEKYSLNFHDQFQKPLLLEFSQKKVMEILSASRAIDDHSKVHYALSLKRQQNRGAFKTIDAVLAENNAKLSAVKYDLSLMEPLTSKLNELSEKLQQIENTLDTLSTLSNLLDKESTFDSRVKTLTSLQFKLRLLEDCDTEKQSLVKISNLLDKADILTNKIEKSVSLCDLCNSLLENNSKSLEKLRQDLLEVEELTKRESGLSAKALCYKQIVDAKESVEILKHKKSKLAQLDNLLELYQSLLRTESENKDIVENRICPICKHQM